MVKINGKPDWNMEKWNPKTWTKQDVREHTKWIGYVCLAAVINFIIETASRHSAVEAWKYLTGKPLVFLYNTLLISICYLLVYLVKRKAFAAILVSFIWLAGGIANGVILANRVTPLTGPDLKLFKDALEVASHYLTGFQMVLMILVLVLAAAALVVLFRRMPRLDEKQRFGRKLVVTALVIWGFSMITHVAIEKRVVTTFFSNVAYAYQDYGFPYCFTTSLFDTGMSQPHNYSEKTIRKIVRRDEQDTLTEEEGGKRPNIIFVQLETFFDPTLLNCIQLSQDPIPNFHRYMEEYSSGYFEVPVVGAGTANTEFETIVGMNLHYFGPGEYPYKTILKKTTCESMAYALKKIGYRAHAIHNNTAEFYGRNEVFANLGFDTFTPIESMYCTQRTETGWADDSILTRYLLECLDSSEEPDYIYTISVQGHGAYPEEQVLTDPVIKVTGAESEEKRNQWEYYVNQLYEMDQFVEELITALSHRDEETVLVMYGDHLPTMGLEARDMKNGHLYSTEYFIWDNMGLEKTDKNLATYHMGAAVTNRLGIHEGTMMTYHQKRQGTKYYMQDMEMLQYDMLYGKQYAFGGENPYVPTDLKIGVEDVRITSVQSTSRNYTYIFGRNFTQYSKLYVNDKEQETQLYNENALILRDMKLKKGDVLVVKQVDKNGLVLAQSKAWEMQ